MRGRPFDFPVFEQTPLEIGHFGGGVNESAVSLADLPPEVAADALNLDYTAWPAVECRAGSAKLGAAVGSSTPVTGLYDVGFSGGTRALLAKAGTVLKKYNSATDAWDSVKTGLTAGNARFATYNDTAVMWGPDAPLKSTDGATWAALGGTPPTAPYAAVHENRMFALGASAAPSRVYHSALGLLEDWTTTTGSGAAGNFDVNTNDGTVGTGLWPTPYRLLIGKERALYELYGSGPENYEPKWVSTKVGPVGQEAGVVVPTGEFYFAARDGIYVYDGFAAPKSIQRPVQATWDTLNASYRGRIAAGYTSAGGVERVLFAIPTGSATTPDKVLVYYPRWDVWWVWSGLAPYVFPCSASGVLTLSGLDYLGWGDASGFVWKGLTGTTDGGTAIAWHRSSGVLPMEGPNEWHYLDQLHIMARTEASGTLSVAYATGLETAFLTAATMDLATETPVKRFNAPFAAGESSRGYVFRVKVSGSGPATVEKLTAVYRRRGT